MINLIRNLMGKEHLKPIIMNKSKQEINFQKLNDKKIKKDLKWKQHTSLNDGLIKTIDWYKKILNYLNPMWFNNFYFC